MKKFLKGRCSALISPAAIVFGLVSALAPSANAAMPVGSLAASLTGQFGTIKGRLVWGGDQAPEQKAKIEKGTATKDGSVCAKTEAIPDDELVVDPTNKGVKNAFVYLVKPKGENAEAVKGLIAKYPKVLIDQKNCRFIPHVVALHQDQTLVLKSSDPTNHNVRYSGFTNEAVNKILPPSAELEVKLVAERRALPMNCDIHPWMTGYIMIFDHPFFAVTGDDGSFEIKGVPVGAQNVVVWQEKVGFVNAGAGRGAPVKVEADKAADLGELKLNLKK